MLNKFFNFLKGYVIIEISGQNPERFVNICLRRGVTLGTVERRGGSLITRVYIRDFKKIIPIRRKTRVRIRILKKRGIKNFARRYKKRAAFLICAILTAVAVYQASNHIWAIEIYGIERADINRVTELLAENGVYIGAPISDMPPAGEIKKNVLVKYPQLSWMWVYMEGSKARVEVFETRTPPKIADKSLPCDIVSAGEGVIKKITAKAGDAAVRVGDAVMKGDTLISGRVKAFKEGEEEKYLSVHALGEVQAYTMRTAEKDEPLYDEIRPPTGAKKRYVTLEIFGKRYELFSKKAEDYADYDIKTNRRELTLPVFGYAGLALEEEQHIEVEPEREPISEELAIERAKDALEEEIGKTLTPFAQKTDERIEYETVGGDTIRVRCTISFIENIGTEEIIKE